MSPKDDIIRPAVTPRSLANASATSANFGSIASEPDFLAAPFGRDIADFDFDGDCGFDFDFADGVGFLAAFFVDCCRDFCIVILLVSDSSRA
ncbi:MAG TPA: hypothetical protein VFV94_00130 [Polyangiaceae bacterium]|nr:hypothetical protein [Polyangiaceae bacterium]